MSGVDFNAGLFTQKTNSLLERLHELLMQNGYDGVSEELREKCAKHNANQTISVAFIGQFSAGKSSIISALTGDKSIKIGTDVTTTVTQSYDWGSFILTDTPGLQNNQEHDAIAAKAIDESDLIIYCITSELFNKNTLRDFKSLAFEKGYKGKIILIVNKINSEYTENIDALIDNYKAQLTKNLHPYSFDEITCCFIDAKDYTDGVTDGDNELIAESRFELFVAALNKYLTERGLICRLETPVLTAMQTIDSVFIDTAENDEEKARRIALTRLDKTVDKLKSKAAEEWDFRIRKVCYKLKHEGYGLCEKIGTDESFDFGLEFGHIADEYSHEVEAVLEELSIECAEELNSNLKDVLESDIGRFLLKSISSMQADVEYEDKDGSRASAAGGIIQQIGAKGGMALQKLNPQQLYNIVKNVGHKVLKIKFKPWGILKAAEKLGKAIKFIGPAGEALGLVMDIKATVDENKQLEALNNARKEARVYVNECAAQFYEGYSAQKEGFIDEVYVPVFDEIQEIFRFLLSQNEKAAAFNSALAELKSGFEEILGALLLE